MEFVLGFALFSVIAFASEDLCHTQRTQAFSDANSNSIQIAAPRPHSVYQRNRDGRASILLSGQTTEKARALFLRIRKLSDGESVLEHCEPRNAAGEFRVSSLLPSGGWYTLEASLLRDDGTVRTSTVQSFGVGEVFITAGQSNAANMAEPTGPAPSHRVSSYNPWSDTWEEAKDPMPVAQGAGGSPWPQFGKLLADGLGMPVGIAAVACGGTSIQQWLPDAGPTNHCSGPQNGNLYQRLKFTTEKLKRYGGVRAILWHQGEADAAWNAVQDEDAEKYVRKFHTLSSKLNFDTASRAKPWVWGVAQATFFPLSMEPPCTSDTVSGSRILSSAFQKIWRLGLAFQGPNTDLWVGPVYRWEAPGGACVHFNRQGLAMHAQGWYTAVMSRFFPPRWLPSELSCPAEKKMFRLDLDIGNRRLRSSQCAAP